MRSDGGGVQEAGLNRFIQLVSALVVCLQLCGGHLGVMQVVAWSGMMVRYASEDGVVEGARKTFDGAHKCCLCKAIDASREKEQRTESTPKVPIPEWSKFGKEWTLTLSDWVPVRHDRLSRMLPMLEPAELLPIDPQRPPTPPPRLG